MQAYHLLIDPDSLRDHTRFYHEQTLIAWRLVHDIPRTRLLLFAEVA